MSDDAKCTCQHCNGHIAFDRSHAGTTIPCPHCKLDTMLFIPPPPPAPRVPAQFKLLYSIRAVGRQLLRLSQHQLAIGLFVLIFAALFAAFMFPTRHDPSAQNQVPISNPSPVTRHPSPSPEWQYATIEWEANRFDREEHHGKILTSFIHVPGNRTFDLLYGQRGAAVVNIERLLNVIGNYRWELVCFDGRQYIVKRPGNSTDGTFYITEEWEELPKNP